MHTTLAHCIKWHTAHTRMFVMHTMMHLAIAHYWTHHTWHTQKFVMHTRLLLSVGFNARLTAAPLFTKALFHTFNQNFSYNNQNLNFFFAAMHFATTLSLPLSSLSWLWYWRWQLGDVSFIGWCIVCCLCWWYFLIMRSPFCAQSLFGPP